jgi:hypothetical protein
VQPVPSVRFPVSSMQPVRTVHGAVVMVRRRSTIRFRNGTPGRENFSNNPDDRRGTSRKRRSLALIAPIALKGLPGASEGSRRRSFHDGTDHRRTSREGTGESPRDGWRSSIRLPGQLPGRRGVGPRSDGTLAIGVAASSPGDAIAFLARRDLVVILTACSVDYPPLDQGHCSPPRIEVTPAAYFV